MSLTDALGDAGLTLDDTLRYWIVIPVAAARDRSWASTAAEEFARAARLEEGRVPPLTAYLEAVSQLARPRGFQWRFVFLVSPELGPTIWDVAVLSCPADVSLVDLVRLGDEGQLGRQTQQFEWNSTSGIQATRFDVDSESEDDERSIAGRSTVAVVRELPGLGQVVLCAEAQSALLDGLALSSTPMQYLLTSDAFADLVAATSDPAR